MQPRRDSPSMMATLGEFFMQTFRFCSLNNANSIIDSRVMAASGLCALPRLVEGPTSCGMSMAMRHQPIV